MRFRSPAQGLTSNTRVALVSVFLTAFGNLAFSGKLLNTYQLSAGNAPAPVSLAAMVVATSVLLDSYGIVINTEMLQNAAQTNLAEALDLLDLRLLAYFVVLGVIPSIAVARIPLHWRAQSSRRSWCC